MHEMEVTILEYFLYLIVLYPIIILFFGQFSPGVIYALEHDCLTETQRICEGYMHRHIFKWCVFSQQRERNKVSLAIVTRYPHLKDSIGSGLVSIKFLK